MQKIEIFFANQKWILEPISGDGMWGKSWSVGTNEHPDRAEIVAARFTVGENGRYFARRDSWGVSTLSPVTKILYGGRQMQHVRLKPGLVMHLDPVPNARPPIRRRTSPGTYARLAEMLSATEFGYARRPIVYEAPVNPWNVDTF